MGFVFFGPNSLPKASLIFFSLSRSSSRLFVGAADSAQRRETLERSDDTLSYAASGRDGGRGPLVVFITQRERERDADADGQ